MADYQCDPQKVSNLDLVISLNLLNFAADIFLSAHFRDNLLL